MTFNAHALGGGYAKPKVARKDSVLTVAVGTHWWREPRHLDAALTTRLVTLVTLHQQLRRVRLERLSLVVELHLEPVSVEPTG